MACSYCVTSQRDKDRASQRRDKIGRHTCRLATNGELTKVRKGTRKMNSAWLTVRQAAERAQVSEATIRREVKARRLTAARVGGRRSWRFRPEYVDEWLQASQQPAIQLREARV
jgi:excisionase family DNA binding protein